ncbi:MAG: amidase [Gammaproteobacteria bacterium]|nr:amidase [Gammaproteobacteria bacterium]
MAARIAAGAAAATHAVSAALALVPAQTLFAREPAEYLPLLEALAPREPATDGAASTAAIVTATTERPSAGRRDDADADWQDLDLCELARRLANRQLRSVEVVRASLARAEVVNARSHCFLAIEAAAAVAAAERADERLDAAWRAGCEPGASLLGVPLAHKDMFERRGIEASCGSRARDPRRSVGGAVRNATVIDRLERAGAVTLGTLNMAEFALGATGHNAAVGDCRNAWNADFIAGGSSSGSGAAVASAAVFGSLGSDTGGSVRIPAAANGVYGLKPTYGLVPRTGSMKLTPSIDVIGPLARSVRDIARLLTIIAGDDGHDPLCSRRPRPDFEAMLDRGIDGLRLGIPRNYFLDDLEAPVRSAYERSLQVLESSGARLVEVEVPGAALLAELSRAVVYPEATALHAAALRARGSDYTAQVRVRASTGLAIPGTTYLEALQLRLPLLERVVGEVFGACELLITPALPVRVPRRDETDIGAGPQLWQLLGRLVQCTAPFNFLGVPALSMPAGRDDRGLPVGMQLVAAPFAESTLLRAAAVHQAAFAAH